MGKSNRFPRLDVEDLEYAFAVSASRETGIFANGTGIILAKNSIPPPTCPFSTGMGMMNVAAGKSQICEICTAFSRAQHIFVTLKSIQLHSVFPDFPNNPEWLELAPQLPREPRQID